MIIVVDNTVGTRTNYRDMIIDCLKTHKIKHVLVRTPAELARNQRGNGKIILTGSTAHVPEICAEQYQMNAAAIDSGLPVLGICFGAQFICQHLGGSIIRMPRMVCDSRIVAHCGNGSARFRARFCARYRIEHVPKNCNIIYLATLEGDKASPVAFGHRTKPIYGTLFHPEYHSHTHDIITRFSRTGTI